MLRSVYRRLLEWHPPGFRQRFGEELLSIFDLAQRRADAFHLLLDASLSLVRQWTLRAEFWHGIVPAAAPQPASDGIPTFYTLTPFRPRTSAMLHGAVLTVTIFCVTCFAIKYSWIHVLHISIPEVHFDRAAWVPETRARASSSNFGSPAAATPATHRAAMTPPTVQSSGLKPPPPPLSATNTSAKPAAPGDAKGTTSKTRLDNGVFQRNVGQNLEPGLPLTAYIGTYIIDTPTKLTIVIATEDETLTMSMARQPRSTLVRVSDTKFVVRGIEDCWIDFLPGPSAANPSFGQLQLSCNGQRLLARRQ